MKNTNIKEAIHIDTQEDFIKYFGQPKSIEEQALENLAFHEFFFPTKADRECGIVRVQDSKDS